MHSSLFLWYNKDIQIVIYGGNFNERRKERNKNNRF